MPEPASPEPPTAAALVRALADGWRDRLREALSTWAAGAGGGPFPPGGGGDAPMRPGPPWDELETRVVDLLRRLT